ncbi:hypothetical protein MNV49_007512 [Pseudohyphozyma bogoriensis]|nr:hypothetical protein MNV49_007512 [Pseudohyphozyma bogoriensis]
MSPTYSPPNATPLPTSLTKRSHDSTAPPRPVNTPLPRIPEPHDWKPPTIPLDPTKVPSPPQILATELRDGFRKHKSLVQVDEGEAQESCLEYRRDLASNKKYEVLGDAALKAAWVAVLIGKGLTAKGLHHFSNILLTNATLSHLAWACDGFAPEITDEICTEGSIFRTQNVMADLCEAYFGALYLDTDGPNKLAKWVEQLEESGAFPTLDEDIEASVELEKMSRRAKRRRS